MKRIFKKSFENQEIRLDNREYVECSFDSCVLTYSGKGLFRFSENLVSSDSKFEVRGQAANTIAALQDLYDLGDWGQSHVLATLQRITGKAETRMFSDRDDAANEHSLGYLVPNDK